MREITIKPGEVVTLGFQGETGATQIRFDVSGWAEEYGEGVFQLVVRAPGSADAYTAAIAQEGDFVLWTVMAEDTAVAGSGYCQLEYYVDTALAKSCGFRTLIAWSVGPSSGYASDAEAWAIGERGGEPVQETDETYHNNAKYYAGEAEASAERAATSADSALETVRAAGTEQVQRVQAAGETQIQAVAQEGAARQAAVVDEGSTQVQCVRAAGAAAAESTAEDIQTAGAAQIQSIDSAAADQLQAIGDMGAVQKAAVVDEGSTQVQRVRAAGDQAATGVEASIETQGNAQIRRVQDAAGEQIAEIAQEGSDQRGAVADAGTAEIQRIQTVGAQTSDAIGDMVEIAEAAQDAATQSASDAEAARDAAAQSAAAAQTAAERDVPVAVAAWLAEHVDPATGYVLDDSLTIQGAAADAKAVGNELKTVKSQLLLDATGSVDYSTLLGNDTFPLGWRTGSYGSTDGAATGSARYIRTVTGGNAEIVAPPHAVKVVASAPEGKYIAISEYDQNGTYITRHGIPNNNSGTGTRTVEAGATPGHIYKLTVGMTEVGVDSSTWLTEEIINQISLTFTEERPKSPDLLCGDLSSYTIVCAKETNYADGTPPTVEWYLIESPEKDFYLTKDFETAQYLFTAVDYNPFVYKFAALKNGDIIAVARVEQISSGSSEDNRKNPFVYLASENWSIKHTVNFGSALKPCGWLENCGFCSMPNGDAMFCEYTRPGVVTANCWKIHGNPTSAASWTVVKSFELSGLANEGFKHCHAVNYDFYNNVYYLCTGDDDAGAQVWYSTDSGVSWTLAREPSEKYCRVLNMIFTPDYIYWASDSSKAASHYLFRAARNANGVIDYSSVVELKNLYVYGVATYGLVYLEELNALVILDKADAELESIPLRIYDISSGELITVATLVTTDGQSRNIGFRTEYSEFVPNGNYVLCGFGKTLGLATYRNYIRGLGNSGVSNKWRDYVNNLKIYIYKTSSGFGCRFRTAFMP